MKAWLLILTCVCGQPKQTQFATYEACVQRAYWEMSDRGIDVPSYRCVQVTR